MSKVTFRADDDLVERVEAHDASKSEVMRAALRAYLDGGTDSERRGEAADTHGRDDTSETDEESGPADGPAAVDESAAADGRTLTEVIDAAIADRIETLVERRVADRLGEVSADTGGPRRADDAAPRRRADGVRHRQYEEPAPRRSPSRERPRRTRRPPTVVVEVPSHAVSDGRERRHADADTHHDHRASERGGHSPSDAVGDRRESAPAAGREPSDTADSAIDRSPDGDVSDGNERRERHTASDTSPSCGQCGSELSDDHVYCPNCGEKAARRLFCECGDEVRSDWSFCPGCGRRTPTADVLDRPTGDPDTRRR
ncbi:zinc ribbon domain-containing protein [Halobaculum sp. MBLA0147]|uniref:double zinc ribbon domain-containing protein n=1 Tax=Halobaculum sp. MBLA0147 TaxID=3079934 RepID=UPI003526B66F